MQSPRENKTGHTDAWYFETLTRQIFQAGLGQRVVESRWGEMRKLFRDFEPELVAQFTTTDVTRLVGDKRGIRNRSKIEATIANAGYFCDRKESFGSCEAWLDVLAAGPDEERERILRRGLSRCGRSTLFYFLYEAGYLTVRDKPEDLR